MGYSWVDAMLVSFVRAVVNLVKANTDPTPASFGFIITSGEKGIARRGAG
jgi:hypothetical protein